MEGAQSDLNQFLEGLDESRNVEHGESHDIEEARESVARLEKLLANAETKRALLLNHIAG